MSKTKHVVIVNGVAQGSKKANGIVKNIRQMLKMPKLTDSGDDLMFVFDSETEQERVADAIRKLGHDPLTINCPTE